MKTRDIIDAATRIATMGTDDLRSLAYSVLERYPAAVIRTLQALGSILALQKVVIKEIVRDRKIYAIKGIRNGIDCGLKEAKDFVEGSAPLPGLKDLGVLATDVSMENAKEIVKRVVAASEGNIVLDIVPVDTPYRYSGI